jgi:hypothetical protein
MSFAGAMLCGLAACKDKKAQPPMPNIMTVGSESVTVDSIAPDSALVIVEDTTVTVGVVATPEAEPHAKKGHKGKKHPPKGKAKTQQHGKSSATH